MNQNFDSITLKYSASFTLCLGFHLDVIVKQTMVNNSYRLEAHLGQKRLLFKG